MDKVLLYFVSKYKGEWDKIYKALEEKEKIEFTDVQKNEEDVKTKYLSIINPAYPNNLKNIYKPPFVLFFEGNVELLDNYPKTSYVMLSDDDSNADQQRLFSDMKDSNHTIVLDSNSLTSELFKKTITQNQKNKFIIIANDVIDQFVAKNKKTLSLLEENSVLIVSHLHSSKFIYDSPKDFKNESEKTAVALSKNLIILKNKKSNDKQGIVDEFVSMGKEIFVFPESINSDYAFNNSLIKHGAILIENLNDVIKSY